ncbi:MAG: trypsin-like peptidase domain-containing protein [Thermoplasmataceae archaeon]
METAGDIEQKIMSVVRRVRGGVVTINNRHFQMDKKGEVIPVQGAATGIVVSSSGYIVSNHHVIHGHQELEITTADGSVYEGRVIGSDPATDVAVIKIDAHGLEEAVLGDSENLDPGRFVVAIGNALGLPGDPTVSVGVVSAIGRPMPWADFIFEGLIQTDAAINPGNSGGPLVDLNGEVVGMNTAIVAYAQGVGFAIPSATIRRVMHQLLENGRVIRPWLGISGVTLHDGIHRPQMLKNTKGVAIARVSRYSPAHYAGLRPWDVITSVNDKRIDSMKSLLEQLSSTKIGSNLTLGILRSGTAKDVSIELQEMPEYYLESQLN